MSFTTKQSESKAPGVPEVATQGAEAHRRDWTWVEASVWNERMLAALENGVKGGKWFSLIDKVYRAETLKVAWQKVAANGGAAGVDGQSVKRFAARAEMYLKELSIALERGTYRPMPVRRVEIAKGGGKHRPLGIPVVKDRIVQTALKFVLEPIFEREFLGMSYGFRPGLGCKDALREVEGWLKEGYTSVVDADLRSYFDTIPHARLMERVKEHVSDGRVVELIEAFLQQDIIKDMQRWTPVGGTPQGAVMTPPTQYITLPLWVSRGTGSRNGMLNGQRIGSNQDFFNHKTQDPLALFDMESLSGSIQTTQKLLQVPNQSKTTFPINYAGLQCLELRSQGGLSFLKFWHAPPQLLQREQALLVRIEQPIHTFLRTSHRFQKSLFADSGGIGLLKLPNPTVHFSRNHIRIFQKLNHLSPDPIVQVVLPHRPVVTDAAVGVTPVIRTQTAVVIEFPGRGPRRGPIVGIATDLTNQHSLKQGRFLGMAGSKDFILLQTFLDQGKGLRAHDGRNGDSDPLLSGTLFVGA